jgi:hypothetical protein
MFVLVESSELIAHLYLIPGGQRFDGTGFIEIDGVIPIGGGVFTGTNFSIPDSGSTLALMGCSIFGLFLLRRKTI